MTKRLTALISGRVQGVGYRFFCEDLAYELSITGYAKNLFDGKVEVAVEGEEEKLKTFLAELKNGPRSAIVTDVKEEWVEATGEFKGFNIE